jgi:hypothetical protein
MTHKPVILAFGLYANETSLSMRKFEPKRDEINEQFGILGSI